jgi:hypothetical protein
MKTKTIYIADDGSRWDTEEKAAERDRLCIDVVRVIAPLGPKPNDRHCSFSNGHGFLQHNPDTVKSVRAMLAELSRKSLVHWFKAQREAHGKEPDMMTVHPSWICRMMEESGPRNDAWVRIWCIDDLGREWGQPFYRDNSDLAEVFEIKREAV